MKPIVTTSLPALVVKNEGGEGSVQYHSPANRIGWVKTKADKPGASFDFVVRDALGREMFRRAGCQTETDTFGQLMNIDTRMGEDFEISLENIKGAEEIELYLS